MIKKIILIILLSFSGIISQEEIPFEPKPKTSDEDTKKASTDSSTSADYEKKYSAQFILGTGKGFLNIISDKYDPNTSLSEFIALSLLSASQASPSYASLLSGNLTPNTLLTLYLLNDELSSNYIRSNSTSTVHRFYLENRLKNEHLGIQFGLSSGQYAFKTDSSKYNTVFLPSAFFGTTNPLINIYMTQSFLKNSTPINLAIDTFDFAFNFHFFPGETFDPYLSVGAGIGSCFTNCTAMRIFSRGGIRYNQNEHYFFIEEEMQMVTFFIKDKRYSPLQERITLIGFGLYL